MKNSVGKWFLATVASVSVTVVVGTVLSRPAVSADKSSVDSLTIELPISCTMETTGSTHTETLVNNTYDAHVGGADEESSATNFTTYCNDTGGYVIYAVGASNNTEGNTNLVGNNGSNIVTGTATSGTTSNWAMKLRAVSSGLDINSDYNSVFASVPNRWVWVVKKESGTVDSTTGSKVGANYAVFVSGTQAAGTYSGQVKYMMFHPSGSASPTSLGEAYAGAGKTKYKGYYKMQDMSSSICSTVNVFGAASQTQLIDVRDDKVYWATKMEDGRCWMTQNLDLDFNEFDENGNPVKDANNNVITKTFTSDDTNLSTVKSTYTANNTIYPLKAEGATYGYSYNDSTSVASWTPSVATVKALGQWTHSNTVPSSYDSGEAYPENNAATAGTHGLVGNYYNWTAAIASNGSGNLSSNNNNATNSICPKGWRLPNAASAEGGYEFSKLLYAYGITTDDKNTSGYAGSSSAGFNKMVSSPLWFVRSGLVNNGSLSNYQGYGYYWSSTVRNSYDAYYLSFNDSGVWPAYSNYGRINGRSIRCIAE